MNPALVRPPQYDVRSRLFDSARWAVYRPRADDIIVATYPKCGTTWTQRIVSMLLAGAATPTPLCCPWFDYRCGKRLRKSRAKPRRSSGGDI